MARLAGANKVYMASAAPPVRYPNVYGIDMPTKDELVAHDRTEEQIREIIGADELIYQNVDAMKEAVRALNPAIEAFEASCFDGVYITGDISEGHAQAMNAQRNLPLDTREERASDSDNRLNLPNGDDA